MQSNGVAVEDANGEPKRLAEALDALANPLRLRLLGKLRSPKVLKEIDLRTDTAAEGSRSGRPISRQGVKHHLEKLLDVRTVEAIEGEREWGDAVEYVVNHQTLFTLGNRLHELARLRPVAPPASETRTQQIPSQPLEERGPALVLVHGLGVGETYSLDPGETGQAQWTIGRSRDLEVALDYDPFVSSRNTVVCLKGGRYTVEDLPGSRNGTRVNFRALEPGEAPPLSTGDLVGVGESLLMFRA